MEALAVQGRAGGNMTPCCNACTRMHCMNWTLSLPTAAPAKTLPDIYLDIYVCLLLLLCLASIIGNSLVFLVFYKRRALLTTSNKFVVNQMICNFMLSIFVMPLMVTCALNGEWRFSQVFCKVTGATTTFLIVACIFSLLLISMDRYIAVVRALRYNSVMTATKSNILLSSVWIVALLLSIGPVLGWNSINYQPAQLTCMMSWKPRLGYNSSYNIFLFVICFAGPFAAMLWIYGRLFMEVHRTGVRCRNNSLTPDPPDVTSELIPNGSAQDSKETSPCSSLGSLRNFSPSGHSNLSHVSGLPRRDRCLSTGSISLSKQLSQYRRNWPATRSLSNSGHPQGTNSRPPLPRRSSAPALGRLPSWISDVRRSSTSFGRRSSTVYRITELFHRDNRRAAKTGLIVTSTFTFCWCPYFVLLLLETTIHWLTIPHIVHRIVTFLAFSSCALNPVVYVFRNKTVRHEVSSLLRGCCNAPFAQKLLVYTGCARSDSCGVQNTDLDMEMKDSGSGSDSVKKF